MATLTKKDLLEAIEDMPMDVPIMVCQVGGLMTEVADAVLSEIQFNNLKHKVIFIKTQITFKGDFKRYIVKEFIVTIR